MTYQHKRDDSPVYRLHAVAAVMTALYTDCMNWRQCDGSPVYRLYAVVAV